MEWRSRWMVGRRGDEWARSHAHRLMLKAWFHLQVANKRWRIPILIYQISEECRIVRISLDQWERPCLCLCSCFHPFVLSRLNYFAFFILPSPFPFISFHPDRALIINSVHDNILWGITASNHIYCSSESNKVEFFFSEASSTQPVNKRACTFQKVLLLWRQKVSVSGLCHFFPVSLPLSGCLGSICRQMSCQYSNVNLN